MHESAQNIYKKASSCSMKYFWRLYSSEKSVFSTARPDAQILESGRLSQKLIVL